MSRNIQEFIREKAVDLFEKVKVYREYMHQYPELSFQEEKTMEYVAGILTKLDIPFKKGVGGTGIVAMIYGKQHTLEMECIGLRADLDALPIQEENDVAYKSKNKGVMHACGHDVHTSILLGAAEIINEIKDEIPFPVKLIFQPGEEKNPGGATYMIRDGVLENPTVKELYALHVFPDMEVGKVGFREGIYMASSDEIYVTIQGKGGHGATPNKAIDPILIGATIVTSIQQIVSRRCDPIIPSVLTFGHFEGIGETNVIPSKVLLKGTFRTLNEVWRAEALDLIQSQITLIAQSMGGSAEVTISKGYPYLENNPKVTKALSEKAKAFLGNDKVEELPIRMTSEDFAFFSQEKPVCFFRLGVRNESKGIVYGVHNSRFDIDPLALVTGIQIICLSVC
ncbi:MAG: amidohydrolase [Flavobacteriia bacterium]|nr:amidohydrolase [Flavobacteriia bacterium]